MKIIKVFMLLTLIIKLHYCDESADFSSLLEALEIRSIFDDSNRYPNYIRDMYFNIFNHYVKYKPTFIEARPSTAIQFCEGNTTSNNKIKFKINPTPVNEKYLISADLRFFLPSNYPPDSMLQVYQIVPNRSIEYPDVHKLRSIYYPSYLAKNGEWLTINIKDAVNDWIQNEKLNEGLLIPGLSNIVYPLDDIPMLIIKYSKYNSSQHEIPFIIQGWKNTPTVIFDDTIRDKPCSINEFKVNFTQWGIISPNELDIGQCLGSCNNKDNNSKILAARNEIIKTLQQQNNNISLCCVPNEYSSAPILYKESNGNYIIRIIENIIARSCICK